MDEWENPNPIIMLSKRAAQRSAEEHQAAHIGPKLVRRRYLDTTLAASYLVHIQQVPGSDVWAGSARQDSLAKLPWHKIRVLA
jgi:hypothetical protein